MQGSQVQSLVREDFTYRGATQTLCHNYWAHCAPTPETRPPRVCALVCVYEEKPPQWGAVAPHEEELRPLQLEKAHAQQHRPNAIKNKWNNNLEKTL